VHGGHRAGRPTGRSAGRRSRPPETSAGMLRPSEAGGLVDPQRVQVGGGEDRGRPARASESSAPALLEAVGMVGSDRAGSAPDRPSGRPTRGAVAVTGEPGGSRASMSVGPVMMAIRRWPRSSRCRGGLVAAAPVGRADGRHVGRRRAGRVDHHQRDVSRGGSRFWSSAGSRQATSTTPTGWRRSTSSTQLRVRRALLGSPPVSTMPMRRCRGRLLDAGQHLTAERAVHLVAEHVEQRRGLALGVYAAGTCGPAGGASMRGPGSRRRRRTGR